MCARRNEPSRDCSQPAEQRRRLPPASQDGERELHSCFLLAIYGWPVEGLIVAYSSLHFLSLSSISGCGSGRGSRAIISLRARGSGRHSSRALGPRRRRRIHSRRRAPSHHSTRRGTRGVAKWGTDHSVDGCIAHGAHRASWRGRQTKRLGAPFGRIVHHARTCSRRDRHALAMVHVPSRSTNLEHIVDCCIAHGARAARWRGRHTKRLGEQCGRIVHHARTCSRRRQHALAIVHVSA